MVLIGNGPCHYPCIATHMGMGDSMKDMTLWVGLYEMLVTLPLVVAGLLLKDRMETVVPQWVRSHRR